MNVRYDHQKDQTAYEIWDIYIPEVLFENWVNHTSEGIADKGFELTTKDWKYLREGYIAIKGKIRHAISEHSQRGFTRPNIGHHGTGRDRYW